MFRLDWNVSMESVLWDLMHLNGSLESWVLSMQGSVLIIIIIIINK